MPRSILVVDNDATMLDVYTRLFAGAGYLISKTSCFAGAVRFINSNNYDLLITDLMLGNGLGTELIKLFERKQAGAKSLLVSGSVKAEVFMAAVNKAVA